MAGRKFLGAIAALITLSGCASLSPDAPFGDVAYMVEERTGEQIRWEQAYHDPAAKAAVDVLLSQPLTAPSAMRIALLNNKNLQAQYADLGVAQAELVQAALPPNPIIDGTITFTDGGGTNLIFAGALNILEILYIPLKKRIAASKLEVAKLQVAGRVLTLASETHCAFVDYLASRQTIELLNQALTSMRAAVAAAKGLREAGNINALEFETQNAELVREQLGLSSAETRSARARERLNVLMGVAGPQGGWQAVNRLPKVPGQELSTDGSEQRALDASLELAASRQQLVTLAGKYRLEKAHAIIPELKAGGEWERDDGEKEAGPVFEAALPIFDWGKARKAKARMEIVRARDAYSALAVKIQSRARNLRDELLNARKTALYHQSTALPQSQRLLLETQRQYNAMQLGVFRLIRAKRDQIQAGENYVRALSTYWIAKARFIQLMKGTLPAEGAGGGACAAPPLEN